MWAAESCMRRALEAMLDLGRHVVAKELGQWGERVQRDRVHPTNAYLVK